MQCVLDKHKINTELTFGMTSSLKDYHSLQGHDDNEVENGNPQINYNETNVGYLSLLSYCYIFIYETQYYR